MRDACCAVRKRRRFTKADKAGLPATSATTEQSMNSRDRRRRHVRPTEGAARRWRLTAGFALIALAFLPVLAEDEHGSAKPDAAAALPLATAARLVRVPLPLQGSDVEKVLSQMQAAVQRLPKDGKTRPLLILEFSSIEGTAGEGTKFPDALKLADALTNEDLSGVRTVAFLPRSVKGHGVLPVIACDEIVMAKDAELGAAGIDEADVGPVQRAGYEDIAERRRTVPKPLAIAMLDRKVELLKVETPEGARVILQSELARLEQSTTVTSKKTLKAAGDLASFSGDKWRHELGYASHLADDHQQLAAALKISESLLDDNPLAGHKPNAVRIDFDGPINGRLVERTIRILRDQLKKSEINLVILWLRSEGGSLEDALELAGELTSVDRNQVRTVVYVKGEARGAAAIVALACDELVMEEGAILGGEGVGSYSENQLKGAAQQLRGIMAQRDRTWSPPLALAGHQEPIRRWLHVRTGERRLMFDSEHAELKNRDDWSVGRDAVELNQGVGPSEAVELGLAQHRARTFEEVRSLYRIDDEIKTARVNWALALIERLADRKWSGLLLFIGTFALFSELSQPGLGVPGFIAGVCFLLFFWANFLHGNADILELLLFVAGVACVFVEVFVAPGTMVFGIGGALMIVSSIVLASQTFILPTNAYQMRQLPGSLLMVVGAAAGGLVGIVVLQRFLPHTPYFKRLILQPPREEEAAELKQRERLSSFEYLLGKRGVALTPLVPAGKAQFGDDVVDVMSDGTLVEVGSALTVVETYGSRIIVRPIEG
jgi:membrane-bound ClpP family serine protease